MSDIIQLLPDNIANQIAAGEVIQRPASAVKELLENAVDAGATEIRLYISDAGKSLIQVIDNGKGMSETDARMCFERHATSKIKNIDDLFHIRTMGFRGEALASIAAVSQVELKTRPHNQETGTCLVIENSKVISQEPCACNAGTSIAMKNLFFNVPARRNFLKSNAVETRHIIDEFIRVAMAFPSIFFSLTSNNQEVFHLEKGSLKQRVVQILGNSYHSKLVSVDERTDYMYIYGFVGKPETAKKSRGDQYFFVNNRFIKSAYLHHAMMQAYQGLIPAESFPMYVLFIDLDPSQIDINVHPTKQEIKFEDERIIYAFVQAAVKHALAQFSITPSLDFELDPGIQQLEAVNKPFTDDKKNATQSSSLFQTFTQKNQAHFIEKSELGDWKDFFESTNKPAGSAASGNYSPLPGQADFSDKFEYETSSPNQQTNSLWSEKSGIRDEHPLTQLHNAYIVAATDNGFLIIHQQLAHERVLYDRFVQAMNGKRIATQKSLFPATFQMSPADAALLEDLRGDLEILGFEVEPFGKDSFVVHGTPADLGSGNEQQTIEQLLEQFKHFSSEFKFSKREKLLRSLAMQQAVKAGQHLSQAEMKNLVNDLFNCGQPNVSPAGNPIYIEFKKDYLTRAFGK